MGGYPINEDDTLKRKILNDATAFLRSYAAQRNRNVSLAETAVTDGKAFTETEALNGKLIDLLASSEDDLLRQLDGRTIRRFDGQSVDACIWPARNESRSGTDRAREISGAHRTARFLFHSADCRRARALHRIHASRHGCAGRDRRHLHRAGDVRDAFLPVNIAGIVLILLALGMFIAEAKFTSHGVLGAGGVVAMLLGALMLIRSPLDRGRRKPRALRSA